MGSGSDIGTQMVSRSPQHFQTRERLLNKRGRAIYVHTSTVYYFISRGPILTCDLSRTLPNVPRQSRLGHLAWFLRKRSRCWAVVAHAFNPSTREAETGGSLGVRGQLGLQELVPGQAPKIQRNTVSKNQKKKKKKKK